MTLLVGLLFLLPFGCGSQAAPSCEGEQCAAEPCQGDDCPPPPKNTKIGDLGRFTATAMTKDGRRVIATYDSTFTNLVLVTESKAGSFHYEILDGFRVSGDQLVDTDSGHYPAVAIANEVVHVVWHDVDGGELRYLRRSPGSFGSVEVVDGAGSGVRGTYSSIAVDNQGVVHVAYRDVTRRLLRYAHRSESGVWSVEDVPSCSGTETCESDLPGDYGEYASIGLVTDLPRIAFYDRSHGDLKLASRDLSGAWTVTTLDGTDPETGMDTGDVGRFASLSVDPKRRLAVAYFDATHRSLRYLSAGQGSPSPITVDDGLIWDEDAKAFRTHMVGQHVTLGFDPSGRAVMVYLDASRRVMRVATVGSGAAVEKHDLKELPAGMQVGFGFSADGVLRGAYGAWRLDELPRTDLTLFAWDGGKL